MVTLLGLVLVLVGLWLIFSGGTKPPAEGQSSGQGSSSGDSRLDKLKGLLGR